MDSNVCVRPEHRGAARPRLEKDYKFIIHI